MEKDLVEMLKEVNNLGHRYVDGKMTLKPILLQEKYLT